ncbi:hypothetical protein [Leucobacter sp. cx-169]|uniref:hypothetical protein n=1 Tax=Leucobacter sp. cx-169 TaxID=2770549 RepID=UPI00165E121A|nr:hypothetical protein [Leucobacter sp. cx-169]MBC9927283.1 hypothetical protein [Leucobacter sp. cx-169]
MNIIRHRRGETVAGNKSGGRFKKQIRPESDGMNLAAPAHLGLIPEELEVQSKFVPEPAFIQTPEEIAADKRAVRRWYAPLSKGQRRNWSDVSGKSHRDDGPARLDLEYGERSYWQHGELHRMDGPAVISQHGRNVEYWEHGKRARSDGGPVLVTYSQGVETQSWLDENEQPHREGAPAVMRSDGFVEWRQHGYLHREDGPARVDENGTQFYFEDGVLNRADNQPSVVYADGGLEWWEDDGRALTRKLDAEGNDVTPRDAEGNVLPPELYPEHMLPHGGNRTSLIQRRVRASMALQ